MGNGDMEWGMGNTGWSIVNGNREWGMVIWNGEHEMENGEW